MPRTHKNGAYPRFTRRAGRYCKKAHRSRWRVAGTLLSPIKTASSTEIQYPAGKNQQRHSGEWNFKVKEWPPASSGLISTGRKVRQLRHHFKTYQTGADALSVYWQGRATIGHTRSILWDGGFVTGNSICCQWTKEHQPLVVMVGIYLLLQIASIGGIIPYLRPTENGQ